MAALFSGNNTPLANRLRPTSIDDVFGQDHLLKNDGAIEKMLESKSLKSMILWGPAGSGKTTIAKLVANDISAHFEIISAVFSGVADLRKIFKLAENRLEIGEKTILFVDEIHRFNKAQQDSFLPFVETGIVTLIGATTENPSFNLNSALLSRCQVLVLNSLDSSALEDLIVRAEKHLEKPLPTDIDARKYLCEISDGDGRYLLNMVEQISELDNNKNLTIKDLKKFIQRRFANYDKSGEGHYNLISALHKSLRGSDVDASIYWFSRMLEGGEDPRYILRRLIRFAVEDIGLADPNALLQAIASRQAFETLGSPEGELAISQLVIYLALAPKSNANYMAYGSARKIAKQTGSVAPPKHILNAPTDMMKELGYGRGYTYDHGTKYGFSGRNYFPETMNRQEFYKPVERGFERDMKKRIEYFNKLREKMKENPPEEIKCPHQTGEFD